MFLFLLLFLLLLLLIFLFINYYYYYFRGGGAGGLYGRKTTWNLTDRKKNVYVQFEFKMVPARSRKPICNPTPLPPPPHPLTPTPQSHSLGSLKILHSVTFETVPMSV